MSFDTRKFDVGVARVVILIGAFVGTLTTLGPLFFLYHILSKGAPMYQWGALSLSLFGFCSLFIAAVLRVKGGLPWLFAMGIPAVQVLLFCYIAYSPHGKSEPSATKPAVEPVAKEVNISFQGEKDGVDRTQQIQAAFLDLAAKCPAAADAVSIVVQYEQGDSTAWRGEKLGWENDLYFNAADSGGEHHHFYLRQDGKKELIINAKQASLDWCGIDAMMKDYYLVTL
ncbi:MULTISPECIES: hypothetical protein [unclassified Aeromonas]|uniref:hypothetical protein n=1 Tax=unclassified Aeromonas TaxID=257493 RepID=UPI0022E69D49|nr:MULTISPECIES: hypothetical protein [unclassified Aeromonas]